MFLDVPGRCWIVLDVFGCCWMFLDAPTPPMPTLLDVHGRSWIFSRRAAWSFLVGRARSWICSLLDVPGRSWWGMGIPGCSLLDIPGCSWMLLCRLRLCSWMFLDVPGCTLGVPSKMFLVGPGLSWKFHPGYRWTFLDVSGCSYSAYAYAPGCPRTLLDVPGCCWTLLCRLRLWSWMFHGCFRMLLDAAACSLGAPS